MASDRCTPAVRPRRWSAAVLAALAALGCGSGPEPSAEQAFCASAQAAVSAFLDTLPAAERGGGGTAVVAGGSELAGGMNGFAQADYAASQHQAFLGLMTLVQYDSTLRAVPYLARSWAFEPGDTTLVFELRRDVYWHDGERTTAADVAFTYVRATDSATAYPYADYFTHYVRGEAGVEVRDSFTVAFRLRPHAEPLEPWRNVKIMPRHLLGDVAPAQLASHPFARCPVGNGPFRFVEHRPNERWVFAANPAFPRALGGPPGLERYVYRVIPDPTAALAELLAGGVDIYLNPPAEHAARIRQSDAARLLHYPFRDFSFIAWNARRPPLDEPDVRRALTLGIDRGEIVDVVLDGYGVVANSGVPPFHWAHDPGLRDSLRHDPAAAAELLARAGWRDRDGDGIRENARGEPLRISLKYNTGNENRKRIAELAQLHLRRIGVRVEPQALEWATLVQQITDPAARDFDGVVLAFVADFRIDDTGLFHSARSEDAYAFAGIRDDSLDHLLERLPLVTDTARARVLWRAYQRRILELQPFTYLYFAERLDGVSRRMRGVHMDVRGEWVSAPRWRVQPRPAATTDRP